MWNIHAMVAARVPSVVAHHCAETLCWDESEMQQFFRRIVSHSLTADERQWMVAYCTETQHDLLDDELSIIAWVTVSEWVVGDEVRIQVQGFVHPDFRGRGLATAMVVCLCNDMPKTSRPIAVFSDEFLHIAQKMQWNAVQYRSTDDGWIGVATTDGRIIGAGADEERLHADAPEVRGVPLARPEEREAT